MVTANPEYGAGLPDKEPTSLLRKFGASCLRAVQWISDGYALGYQMVGSQGVSPEVARDITIDQQVATFAAQLPAVYVPEDWE